jgi:hypothetical protein
MAWCIGKAMDPRVDILVGMNESLGISAYRVIDSIVGPLVPLLRRTFPNYVLSTQEIGLAMLFVARHGYSKPILETQDIRAVVGAVAE